MIATHQLANRQLSKPVLIAVLFTALLTACGTRKYQPAISQKTFGSADEAADALVRAVEADDVNALMQLFGDEGKELIVSGDPVQDKNMRAAFAVKLRAGMTLERNPGDENRAVIMTGEDEDPFAVPLVRKAGGWRFDTDAGLNELVARRIGSNELDTIDMCAGYVDAQKKYAMEDPANNGIAVYAQRFISSPGRKDGLYWPPELGGAVSPIAVQVTRAVAEGYRKPDEKPVPYHGYYYKILKGQGPNAPGGRRDYVHRGLMLGGFGLVAWPADYGASGIKTFIVDQDGVVLEKDLGDKTSDIANAMIAFDPDPSWRPVH